MSQSQQSATIGKLAEALSKAQATIRNAVRDSANPFFKSNYADLASVRDAYQQAFSENGLALVQMPYTSESGRVGVETMLMHSSGEWVKREADVRPVKDDPQAYGSCVTYLRRYSAAAFAGLATEDDDAEAGQGRVKAAPQKPARTVVEKSEPKKPEAAKPEAPKMPYFQYDESKLFVVPSELCSDVAALPQCPWGKSKGKSWAEIPVASLQGLWGVAHDVILNPIEDRGRKVTAVSMLAEIQQALINQNHKPHVQFGA